MRFTLTKTHTLTTKASDESIKLGFMNSGFRVFLSSPLSKDPIDYLAWLAKLEKKKSKFWKDMGIFDLIKLSKIGPT